MLYKMFSINKIQPKIFFSTYLTSFKAASFLHVSQVLPLYKAYQTIYFM